MSGFGDPEFDKIREAKKLILSYFEKKGLVDIEKPDDSEDLFRGHYVIDVSNNYFTKAELVDDHVFRPLREEEDPYGIMDHLNDIGTANLVRVSDNDVYYYTAKYVADEHGVK